MRVHFANLFRPIPALLREALPAELGPVEWSATSWMAKAWFGNRAIHYELWVRHSAKVIELGLHFEADALTNARLYGAFRARAREVKRALGAEARIEEWDKGWARVWEPFALEELDQLRADRIRTRFVDYVRVLEPILRDELPSDVPWTLARSKPVRAAKRTAATKRATARRGARGSALRASRSAR
jgi:hypothetical protein